MSARRRGNHRAHQGIAITRHHRRELGQSRNQAISSAAEKLGDVLAPERCWPAREIVADHRLLKWQAFVGNFKLARH